MKSPFSYMFSEGMMLLVFFLVSSFCLSAQNDNQVSCVILSEHERADLKKVVDILNEVDGITFKELNESTICFYYESEAQRSSAMEQLNFRGFEVSGKNNLPITFPLLNENPSPQQQEDFNEQKAAWIEANPDQYEVMQQNEEPQIISQDEFDQFSSEKQQHILNNPQLYIIE